MSEEHVADPQVCQAGVVAVGAEYTATLTEKDSLKGMITGMSEQRDFDKDDFQAGAFAVGAQYEANLSAKEESKGTLVPTGGLDLRNPPLYGLIGIGNPWWTRQHKCFYTGSFFFVFYEVNDNLYYRSSANGVNWNTPVLVSTLQAADDCAITRTGSTVHLVRRWWSGTPSPDWLYYRQGTISDGSISWEDETLIDTVPAGEGLMQPSIAVDSNGYPFVAAGYTNTQFEVRVYKCATTDGTGAWTKYTLWTGSLAIPPVAIVSLLNGKMYIVYYTGSFKGKLWNGSSWESEETIGDGYGLRFDIVSFNDTVHFTTDFWVSPKYRILYACRKGSWSSLEEVCQTDGYSPALLIYGELVHIFWRLLNEIWYCTRRHTWDAPKKWFTNQYGISIQWGTNVSTGTFVQNKAGIVYRSSPTNMTIFVQLSRGTIYASKLKEK